MADIPSIDRLREVLSYDPLTGKFSRNDAYASGREPGTFRRFRGHNVVYRIICVDKCRLYAHRLAWLFTYGDWPHGFEIDHKNGDGLDNRILNLRKATRGQNATNASAQKSNKTGLRGVHFHPGANRYRAQITKSGKTKSLGYFDTAEAAHAAYLTAATMLHGEFVRTS